jgi:RNA polymerase sigma-70 factor (ECF subfamily)
VNVKNESSMLSRQLASAQFDLYAFISVLMRGRSETSDVLQDTNLAILSHESAYDPARPFLPWARGVARKRVLRYYQEKGRERLVFNDSLFESLAEKVPCAADDHSHDELERLRKCMGHLVSKQRDMVTARYLTGEAVKDIAVREKCSEGAVSMLLYRVRQLLADCMAKDRKLAGGV